MNILYIYHDYYGRRKKYGYLLADLGHRVRHVNVGSKTKGKPVSVDKLEGIDFVLALNSAYVPFGILSEEFLAELKKKGIPLACYSTCLCEKTFEETVEICQPFDFVFETMPQVTRAMKQINPSGNYHCLPHGFHKEQFFKSPLKKRYDVSFAGHAQRRHMKRRELLQLACDHFDVTVFGKAICQRLGRPKRRYNTTVQERQIHNHSRVCLNLPFYDSTMPHLRAINAPNDRFFEISACGSIQLNAYDDCLAQMFEPDKECFYYNSPQEMIDKLGYILKNYEKLEHVGRAARIRALQDHQYRHRIERMMRIVRGQSGSEAF